MTCKAMYILDNILSGFVICLLTVFVIYLVGIMLFYLWYWISEHIVTLLSNLENKKHHFLMSLVSVILTVLLIGPSVFFGIKCWLIEKKLESSVSDAYFEGNSLGYDAGYADGRYAYEKYGELSEVNSSSNSDVIYCYVSYGGDRYHRSAKCAGSDPVKITVDEAKSKGESPCEKCW